MKILCVFEMVPDETNIYMFENPTPEETKILIRGHGTYGNTLGNSDETNEANQRLSELLVDRETIDQNAGPIEIDGMVVVAGFIL